MSNRRQAFNIYLLRYTKAKGCRHVGYFKIKAIELLYYMEQLTQINSCDFKYFDKRQIEATKAIRDYLIGHLDEKISLECLAKEAHLNLTVFHNIFSIYMEILLMLI